MKFFIDTADINEIKEANKLGVLDGVTTNPSLIAKVPGKFEEILLSICEEVDGPVSAEVVSLNAEGMIREGRELAKIHKNIVIKIPIITTVYVSQWNGKVISIENSRGCDSTPFASWA